MIGKSGHKFSMVSFFLTEKPPCIFEIQFPDPTIIQDSHKLQQAVAEIGNWQSLCENLKVDRGTMDMLKYSNDHPKIKKSDCLNAYFDKGDAVWEEVVLAVAQHPVDEVDIARNIANKYLQEHNLAIILKLLQSLVPQYMTTCTLYLNQAYLYFPLIISPVFNL